MRRFLLILVFVILILANGSFSLVKADFENDYVLFCQVMNGVKTIYISKYDGTELQPLVTGKDLTPFSIGKHFLYFTNHQLFEYDLTIKQSRLLSKFTEDQITLQELSNRASGGPDQVLVIAETSYERNLYVLEFPDGEMRMVQSSFVNSNTTSSSLKSSSPDEKGLAIIRTASMNYRFELQIQQKINNKFKTVWTIPRSMTVIPERPIWAPNSQWVAFYAKEFNNLEGFYSLYLYHIGERDLQLIQEQVFSKFAFGNLSMDSFVPNWSKDSRYLVFQYQPYGLPTESSIIKYDVEAKEKTILANNRGHHLYPTWSPTVQNVLFIWNRNTSDQLFTVDAKGENIKQLSPSEGYTEWAKWYTTE